MLPILGLHDVVSPVDAFILDVTKYIEIIRPKEHFIFLEDFDPSSYFITSGDAIEKAKALKLDLQKYKDDILKTVQVINAYTDFEIELLNTVDTAIEGSSKLLNDLYAAKGENCFLETEWESHLLYVVPKNPRR